MRGTRGRKGDNARRTPVSERAYECVCDSERERERVGEKEREVLATFLKERVRKGREAGEVSHAPPLPPLGRGQRGVTPPPALGDI